MFDHTAAVESNHIFESPTVQLLCRTTNHWSSQVIGKRKVTFRGLTFCKAILISCLSVPCCMISVLESYGLLCQIVICGKIERSQLVQYSINSRLSIRTQKQCKHFGSSDQNATGNREAKGCWLEFS